MVLRARDTLPRVPASSEIGSTGLHEFDGIIHEEILRRLQWPLGNKIWREMSDNDSVVAQPDAASGAFEELSSKMDTPGITKD